MRLDTVKIYASTIWTHSFVALSEDLYIATHMNYVTNALYEEIFSLDGCYYYWFKKV